MVCEVAASATLLLFSFINQIVRYLLMSFFPVRMFVLGIVRSILPRCCSNSFPSRGKVFPFFVGIAVSPFILSLRIKSFVVVVAFSLNRVRLQSCYRL